MTAAGLWNKEELERAERKVYKKAHCVPNDIKTQTLINLVAHRSAVGCLLRRPKALHEEVEGHRDLHEYGYKDRGRSTLKCRPSVRRFTSTAVLLRLSSHCQEGERLSTSDRDTDPNNTA